MEHPGSQVSFQRKPIFARFLTSLDFLFLKDSLQSIQAADSADASQEIVAKLMLFVEHDSTILPGSKFLFETRLVLRLGLTGSGSPYEVYLPVFLLLVVSL